MAECTPPSLLWGLQHLPLSHKAFSTSHLDNPHWQFNPQSTINNLKPEYKAIIGDLIISNVQVAHVVSLLISGSLYCGSDGSEKGVLGSHAFAFTSSKEIGPMWGTVAITPGNSSEMSSLRTEHAGALAILLVLYAFQIQLEYEAVKTMEVSIWLDSGCSL